jgi:biotin carboxyl carrier protein
MDVKKFSKKFAGKDIEVIGQVIGPKLWIKANGHVHVLDLDEATALSAKKSKSLDRVVKAPMPGKIIKIFCSNHSAVNEGDAVVAMEAMKMEYILKAPANGLIDGLSVTVGQQVELGQKLFEVKNENPNR